MPIVADAAARVGADMSPFHRELKSGLAKGGKEVDGFGAKMKSAFTPGNLLGAAGIGFGVAQITSVIAGATNAAAEFNDTVGATGVIMGQENVEAMEKWADAAARNFGASKQDALQAANQIAGLGKMAGLAGADLVGFSQELVELGGDLASMYGGTVKDAITAVSAGLRGENEPLRRYNILLDDATLRQKAFEMGIIDTVKNALTPQQKVLAAQAAIMEQSTDAQGDFLRTSDQMANVQRTVTEELANMNIELGEKLMPTMLAFATWMREDGIPLLGEFLGLLDFGSSDSAEGIAGLEAIEDVINGIADAGPRLNDKLTGNFGRIADGAKQLGITYDEMRVRVRSVLDEVGGDHEKAVARVLAADKAWEQAKGWEAYQNAIRGGGDDIDAAAADMADGIPQAMEDAKEAGEEIARSTPGSLADQLREGIDDYDEALEELTVVAENSVSDLAERQKIEGILASQELTEALNSDSLRTRLLAQELVADLVSDYELLAPGALAAGETVNPKLQDGILSNIGLAVDAGEAVVDAAGNPLVDTSWAYEGGRNVGIAWGNGLRSAKDWVNLMAWEVAAAADPALHGLSPPKEGPLKHIDDWGESIGRAWAEGLGAAAPWVRSNSETLAGAAAGLNGVGIGSVPVAGGAAIAGSTGPTYILQVDGKDKVVGSREEVLDAWAQMEQF